MEAAVRARSIGVQSMVGFNYRCIPALALARALIADGRIGAVREVRAAYLQDWLVDESAPMSWRLRKESSGLRRARRPGLPRDRPASGSCLDDEIAWASGHLATFVPTRPGDEGHRVGHSRRCGLGFCFGLSRRRGRQCRGQPDGIRPQERARARDLRHRGLDRLRPRTAQRAVGRLRRGSHPGPGDRVRPSAPGRLVAAGPRAGLGSHLHYAGRDVPGRARCAAAARHRRSRTAWPCSGSST